MGEFLFSRPNRDIEQIHLGKVFSYVDVKLVRSPPNSWNIVGTMVLETI